MDIVALRTQQRDATKPLEEALKRFESVLTDDEKRKLQPDPSKPEIRNVIAFVKDIDARNSTTRRECVAPRLYTFLEATKQFTDIVETFVSSNPQIAALVWGGVKLAIIIANNISSYFTKVTRMIMEVGKSCPIYEQFSQLYPSSARLQCELCVYYATVIDLFTKIIKVSRRSPFIQTASSIISSFESDFQDILEQLRQSAETVKQQISLASKQADFEAKKLLELENRDNTTHRKLFKVFEKDSRIEHSKADQWRMNKKKRETARLRNRTRCNLSTINYDKPWKQAFRKRVPSTAEWLQKELIFQKWKDGQETSTLWCAGKIGTGKSVLMSNIVAQLHASCHEKDVISYFFCRADNAESLSARSILGSLTYQLLQSQINHANDKTLQDIYEASKDLDTAGVVDFLLCRLEDDKKYFIVIDGLDDCDPVEILKVAKGLDKLRDMRKTTLKVLCAGHPELERRLFRTNRPDYRVLVSEEKVKVEMDQFIETALCLCIEEGQLKLDDSKLILDISEALLEGSDGMFLWVRLFIDELCVQDSDHEIMEALRHLPKGLSELFHQKLSRITDGAKAKNAIQTLQFCGVLKQPLTTMDYQHILSLSPGQKSFERRKLVHDIEEIIGDCRGLAFIDEEDETVHYVHNSLKQYLFAGENPYAEEFHFARIDQHLGILCMTYLDFTDFKRQLARSEKSYNTPFQPLQLGISSRLAKRLLLSRHKLQSLSPREFERKTQEVLSSSEPLHLDFEFRGFPFFGYAKTYWIHHLANLDPDTASAAWRLFSRCIEGDDIVASKPWESPQETGVDIPKTISWSIWASTYGHLALLIYFKRNDPQIFETVQLEILQNSIVHGHDRLPMFIIEETIVSSSFLQSALLFASARGCNNVVACLLRENTNINAPISSNETRTALQAAAEGGYLEIVERLLAAKADVNARPADNGGRTALQAAAEGGHLEIVERLLAAKADVNARPADNGGRTALQAAAEGGHLEIVERLLAAKADVNARPAFESGRTVLQAAAEGGHLEIVERLLAAKADVNARPAFGSGRTVLQAAAEGGHLETVERLLAAKADVNAEPADNGGRTALQAAAGGGYLETVERLLAAKADVNAEPAFDGGRTALQAAAGGGYLETVERLLAAKADVNARSASGGRTALQAAAEGGHLEIVERLLAAKADVNARPADNGGRTALQAAAEGGHLEIVERLLAAKADVNAEPAFDGGRTALQAAAGGGYLETVERLLAAKADVNARSASGGRTALQAAAEGGHLEIVERLLAAKADVNAESAASFGQTALQAAAEGGHLEIVERLLAAKADVNAEPAASFGQTALQAAAEGGHLEIVERLLAAKADVNARPADNGGRTALQAAAEGGYLETVERLLAAKADVNAEPAASFGQTALQAAAGGGYLETVERLLAAKADVNARPAFDSGRTVLQAAAEGGHLETVERLLAAKADVNAEPAFDGGRTALQAAAGGGYLEIVERLLAAKADVNARPAFDSGRTALQAAAEGGHIEIVERLLAAKAEVNAEPAASFGRTALQAAAEGGHLEIVERLLAAKADVNARPADNGGRTALQAAAKGGYIETGKRLLAAGAIR